MDAMKMIEDRRRKLAGEVTEAKAKYVASLRDMREKRTKWKDLKSRWEELLVLGVQVEHEAKKAEEQDGQVDAETGARVSKLIWTCLANSGPRGATLADIAAATEHAGIKRTTISATLYNMKKRGEIEHSEATGYYALPAAFFMSPTRRAIPR